MSQQSLPNSDPSSFLVVGNVDDDANFTNQIKSGHTAHGDQPVAPNENHMVLLGRSRFFIDLLSFTATPDSISKMKAGEDLLCDDDMWNSLKRQLGVDVPRQDVFVGDSQVQTMDEFVTKVSGLLSEAADGTPAPPQPTQGWVSWTASVTLRVATLGLLGGGANAPAIPNSHLKTPEGRELALRMAVACAQQGALAIMLDGVQAQFSNFDDVHVGEVSPTDALPANAPTRRSCVVVKKVGTSPVVEVRKLLRMFKVSSNSGGAVRHAAGATTVMFVHTLLTVPLNPHGKHDVCLEWKVTMPPPPLAIPAPKSQTTPKKPVVEAAVLATPPSPPPPPPPAPVPLVVAERLPETAATAPLTDEQLALQLQREFEEEDQRQQAAQMKRDQELAKALAQDPPESQGPTLLEEAVTRRRNKKDDKQATAAAEAAVAAVEAAEAAAAQAAGNTAATTTPASSSSSSAKCTCLGASSGFHRLNCPFRNGA